MKKLFLPVLMVFSMNINAQEKKEIPVKTEVSAVTVFMSGAQVTRKKTVELPAGKSIIKFTDLSPYIDAKSIQVRTGNDVFVLSVNQQFNYMDTITKNKVLRDLIDWQEALEDKLFLETTNLEIIKEEYAFLNENRVLGGKNQEVSLPNLKQTADYFHEKISALKLKEIEINKKIDGLTKERNAVQKQITQEGSNKIALRGEILVNVDAKAAAACEFTINYVVSNASWYPSYDIRAKNITEPVELRYKANIHQNTKEDWKNVKLKLSSSNPSQGNTAPKLKPYYLDYYSAPPRYNAISEVSGTIFDTRTHETIPGATVWVVGTTIATSTDMNGYYSLSLPENANKLVVSSVGYITQNTTISNSTSNIALDTDLKQLSEMVVTNNSIARESRSLAAAQSKTANVKIRGTSSFSADDGYLEKQELAPVDQVENQTSIDFDIKTAYTINSDNKNTVVDMDIYSLNANYEYYCVPKIDKDAFLIANILDWEKYNLLAGEANIFFENTFVGKSILDLRYVTDTLKISLGRDKSIVVKREKIKDYTTRQFIGSKKEETKAWQLSIKNNKQQTINIVVYDQIPVSTLEEIEVTTDNLSGGNFNKENGEVKWKLNLEPATKKDIDLKYKIKYPKDKALTIE
jgi:hypothetical protein